MRTSAAVTAERHEGILAVLEERPYTVGELAAMFGLPSGMNSILKTLVQAGRVQRLRDGRWALPGTIDSSPVGGPDAGPAVRTFSPPPIAEPEDVEEEDELEDDESDLFPELLDAGEPDVLPPNARKQVRAALRQPHERPGTASIPKGGAPSWWVGASREELNAGARARQESMRGSKENLRVPLRIVS